MRCVVVFITAADKKQAEKIALGLLESRAAACVNIIKGVDSYFLWKGKKEKSMECLLIAKTAKRSLSRLIKTAKRLHSYDVPEIIALPVIAGYKPYLDWVKKETR